MARLMILTPEEIRLCCYDNSVVETFFHTLKVELVHDCVFVTKEQAKLAIFEYLEVFYNQQRLHSTLGYCPPE